MNSKFKTQNSKLMYIIIVLFISFASCILNLEPAFSDSIWKDTSSSPYAASKSFRVGDVITIIILETTSAAQKAGTDTNVDDSLATSIDHNITRLGFKPSNFFNASAGNTYKGLGSTSRSSKVTARVAAVVTKVLPNGNLLLSAEHRVEVNSEVQIIRISGMIRPKDVSLANTVFSYQVAGADVSIKGSGTVGEAQEPGVFTRFFNWIF